MKYVNHVSELIGNTPLIKLNSVTEGIKATVLAKVEYFNPGGSIKDRIAEKLIDAAEEAGLLKPGGTIVEPTSGNTGIGLALIAQQRGYRCIFTVPDKVAEDKRNTLKAYGSSQSSWIFGHQIPIKKCSCWNKCLHCLTLHWKYKVRTTMLIGPV
jgi:cystathionine beta-synthase